jgi:dihydroorotase
MEYLVNKEILNIEKMVSLFTIGPANILGLNSGTLGIGTVADLTIIDPNITKKVDINEFYSKGKNTPFNGLDLKGWPFMTIKCGKVIAVDGKIIG